MCLEKWKNHTCLGHQSSWGTTREQKLLLNSHFKIDKQITQDDHYTRAFVPCSSCTWVQEKNWFSWEDTALQLFINKSWRLRHWLFLPSFPLGCLFSQICAYPRLYSVTQESKKVVSLVSLPNDSLCRTNTRAHSMKEKETTIYLLVCKM